MYYVWSTDDWWRIPALAALAVWVALWGGFGVAKVWTSEEDSWEHPPTSEEASWEHPPASPSA
jgi:hypothetical protein